MLLKLALAGLIVLGLIIGLLIWLALGTQAQMERNDNRPAAVQQD